MPSRLFSFHVTHPAHVVDSKVAHRRKPAPDTAALLASPVPLFAGRAVVIAEAAAVGADSFWKFAEKLG